MWTEGQGSEVALPCTAALADAGLRWHLVLKGTPAPALPPLGSGLKSMAKWQWE